MFQSACKQLTWKKGHVESCRHVKVKVVVWMDADADGWVCLWVIQRWSDYGVLFLSVKRQRQTNGDYAVTICMCSMYYSRYSKELGIFAPHPRLTFCTLSQGGSTFLSRFKQEFFPPVIQESGRDGLALDHHTTGALRFWGTLIALQCKSEEFLQDIILSPGFSIDRRSGVRCLNITVKVKS